MHAINILHKTLQEASVIKDPRRQMSLLDTVDSVLGNAKLSLTSLGRHMQGEAKVKNKIKKVDRLFNNIHLNNERMDIYKAIASLVLGCFNTIEILIDWSPAAHHDNQILRASVVSEAGSLCIYEEVHPEKKLGNANVHKQFLQRLKEIIPSSCKVIITTDAGFRTDFFRMVLNNGWEFVGRVRSNMLYTKDVGAHWDTCASLHKQAEMKTKYIGEILLSKSNAFPCHMYLHKEEKQKVKTYKRRIRSGKKDKTYIQSYKDPWLLVTSLKKEEASKKFIVNTYRKRMKIEHEFRNIKNEQWGLGLKYTRTYAPLRLEILLLIGTLAMFTLWLIGLTAENMKLHYHFQANTIRHRRVLSLVFLGSQIIFHQYLHLLTVRDLESSLRNFQQKNIKNIKKVVGIP